jgi:hypothetical protein
MGVSAGHESDDPADEQRGRHCELQCGIKWVNHAAAPAAATTASATSIPTLVPLDFLSPAGGEESV